MTWFTPIAVTSVVITTELWNSTAIIKLTNLIFFNVALIINNLDHFLNKATNKKLPVST